MSRVAPSVTVPPELERVAPLRMSMSRSAVTETLYEVAALPAVASKMTSWSACSMTSAEALKITPTLLESTTKSVGSSSSLPRWPRSALRSTTVWKSRFRLPDTSAKPPLPPAWPPRALMRPAALVSWSAQATILPPSPFSVASALSQAFVPSRV